MKPGLTLTEDVSAAIGSGQPVVALESTIVTHGMPYPDNLETARSVERIIRDAGAVPATIAVLSGAIHVGLDEDRLAALAGAGDVRKLSRADLAVAMARGWTGSTTVAATMICAHAAGIAVFATGGIGGVHRGVEATMDISADLEELARTPVTVVAAGAKAILDLPRTLEVLETKGVPVFGYGTDEFPAFWSRSSGLSATLRADSPDEIAQSHQLRASLGIDGGQLVANPISSAAEIPASELGPVIDTAIAEADEAGISGKDVTPFLLDRIRVLTDGRSLVANRALIEGNARLAAEIATALARLR